MCSSRCFAVLAMSTVALTAIAQVPPPPVPSPPRSEIISMPSFEVVTEQDQGYIAVNSLAGGRSNTPIRLTPSAMSSLTRTFLEDVGITDVREALQWSLNVVPSDPGAGKRFPFGAWDFNFRGAGQSLHGGSGPTRNYFTFYQVADSYNIERIEFDRGPNSILFGVGTVGGVLSTYTKQPRLDQNFATPTLIVDNHGTVRGELDVNRVLSDRLALRLNLLAKDERGWRRHDRNEQQAVDLALLFKPTERTTVRLELEASRAKNTLISGTVPEGMSLWDQTTVADTATSVIEGANQNPLFQAGVPGVERINPWGRPAHWVYVPELAASGVQDYAQSYRTIGTYLPVAPAGQAFYPAQMQNPTQPNAHPNTALIPGLPDDDTTFGAGLSRPRYENVTAWIEQRLTDRLEAQLSLYHYSDEHNAKDYEGLGYWAIDVNRQLPDGSVNPKFGEAFGEFLLTQQQQNRSVNEARLQFNYEFHASPWGVPLTQRFVVAGGRQEINWKARQYLAQFVDGPPPVEQGHNLIWGRLYASDPNRAVDLPPAINGRAVAYAPWATDWFDFDEEYELSNVSLVSHSRLWNDRLSVLLGARYDDYTQYRIGTHSRSELESSADGMTYSVGAIYYFHWLGVYANYSRNFEPITAGRAPTIEGAAPGPAEGRGTEYGLRVSTDDGRYYASLGRYDSRSEDRLSNLRIPVGAIWTRFYETTGVTSDPGLTGISYSDTESLEVSGYEFEITANPSPRLRLQAGYSRPDSEIVEAMSGQRAYFGRYLAQWNAAAAGEGTGAPELRTLLINAQQTLDSAVQGETKTGLVKYTANAFANYTFTEGAFDGFSIGGGAARTGEQYLRHIRAVPMYVSERTTTTLVLAYQTRIRGFATRFALNVNNVFDDDDVVITNYDGAWTDGAGDPLPNGYSVPAPRTYRLTVRLTF